MEVPIVQIGNAKGIRLPKMLLQQYDISDKVEIILKDGFLILKPVKKVREGWAEAFQLMAKNGEDTLLIDDVFEDEVWDI
ncbi:MAG: AbrB/MazE/SpoVT family DNA-binding domain-containing protein [Bacteroidota bacterium]